VGRPSALYFAENLSRELNAKIYLKREDLNHTGAHGINHTVAQAILAKRMGRGSICQKDLGWLGQTTGVSLLGGTVCISPFLGALEGWWRNYFIGVGKKGLVEGGNQGSLKLVI